MFTVEEITLLRSFDTSTRRTAILSLMNEMGMMQDDELIAQCLSMVKKLENTKNILKEKNKLMKQQGRLLQLKI